MNGLVNKIMNNSQQCDDVLQEGFIKVWKNINDYEPHKSGLFTWMYTIIRNTAIDHLRREGKRKIQSLDSDVYDNVRFSQNAMISDVGLIKKINSLDPKYKQIIELVYLEGYTQQEIADELKLPLGTVKTRVSTALKLLRSALTFFIYLLTSFFK